MTPLAIARISSPWAYKATSLLLSRNRGCLSIWKKLFLFQLVGFSSTSITSMKLSSNECSGTTARSNNAAPASLVICGPSGVGKGTIIHKFMKEMGGSEYFGFSCSHTTRKPRPGEVDGVHYHFTNMEDMQLAIANNYFLEWARIHDNFYGTSFSSIESVQQGGKICLLDIDVQGVQKIKRDFPNFYANYVFIAPPTKEILKERLFQRGTETPESLQKRTLNAIKELDYGLSPGNFQRVIVNDNLDVACQDFKKIVNELYQNVII